MQGNSHPKTSIDARTENFLKTKQRGAISLNHLTVKFKNKMDFKELKKQFDNMDEQEQYAWLVQTDLKEKFKIILDNDNTSLLFLEVKEDGDQDGLTFKDYIGNGAGVGHLFDAVGIKWEDC